MSSLVITNKTFDLAINKHVFTFNFKGQTQEVVGDSELECTVLVARFALLRTEGV